MASNPYNGFSPQSRSAGGRWYRSMRAQGRLLLDDRCYTCGSPQRVNGHSEDYSAPYGAHIGAFDLCWLCHMMIHCRHRNGKRFDDYVRLVDAGLRFDCDGMQFDDFTRDFLAVTVLPERRAIVVNNWEPTVFLTDIRSGRYNPNKGGLSMWAPEHKLKHFAKFQTSELF